MGEKERIKVLLLDDEYLVRMSVIARLRKTAFDVVGVGSPDEAVAALKKTRFQAIITDVMMGDVDGFMFRDIVRGMDREIPIIFFTGLLNDDDNRFLYRVLEDPFSSYLPKNAPTDVLHKQLDQVTRAYRAEASARALQGDLDATMHLASFVQTSLLPRWAQVKRNLFYGACWQPFLQVSGDLYEWIPITAESSLFFFGDISGHGVSASLAMTAAQSFLKQFATLSDEKARDVARIASQIDKFFCRNLYGVAYMCAAVVYVNARESRIRVCHAGYQDIRCYSREGERIDLNPEHRGGLPLGMVRGSTYTEADVVDCFAPRNCILFALSDGITDLSSDAEGEERVPDGLLDELMRESVRSLGVDRTLSAVVLPHRILSMLSDFGYEHVQDDMSLVSFGQPFACDDEFYVDTPMDVQRIDGVVRKVGEFLQRVQPEGDLVPRVELLLGEFLMNLHDHGFEDATRHKECALVRVLKEETRVVVTVWHRARAWEVGDPTQSPDAALDSANARMDDHGRGVAIIRKICTTMASQRFGSLNANVFYVPCEATDETRAVQ